MFHEAEPTVLTRYVGNWRLIANRMPPGLSVPPNRGDRRGRLQIPAMDVITEAKMEARRNGYENLGCDRRF